MHIKQISNGERLTALQVLHLILDADDAVAEDMAVDSV
jgi:hypothetical protein